MSEAERKTGEYTAQDFRALAWGVAVVSAILVTLAMAAEAVAWAMTRFEFGDLLRATVAAWLFVIVAAGFVKRER